MGETSPLSQPLTNIATGADPRAVLVYPQEQTNTVGRLTLTICVRSRSRQFGVVMPSVARTVSVSWFQNRNSKGFIIESLKSG